MTATAYSPGGRSSKTILAEPVGRTGAIREATEDFRKDSSA
jgi:hypothetical protein